MGILLHQELTWERDRSLHVHLDDTSPGYKIRPPLVKWQQWQQSWELASKKGGLVNFVTNLNPNSSQLCQLSWDSEKDLRPRITLHLSNLQSPMPTQLRGDLGTILSVTYFCMHASCDLTSPLLDCLNIKCLSFWDSETSSDNFVDLNLVPRVFWLSGQWGNALPLWPEDSGYKIVLTSFRYWQYVVEMGKMWKHKYKSRKHHTRVTTKKTRDPETSKQCTNS